jgi:hypothetical protein
MDDIESQPQYAYAYESQPVHKKTNIFNQLDNKFIYIILFVVFLLGFFVGKSFMQPVIIRTVGTA